jgi:Co/Zn/Cd efflux system component
MSADCCGHGTTFEGLSADYKRRLWLVIALNATMFLVEMGAGALAGSQALQADALDFLGDAMASLFLISSIQILRQSLSEMRAARLMPAK